MNYQVTDSKAKKWSTSPCAGCKFQRRKCSDKCVLAPYFPQQDLQKFLFVHRVFGNGNVIRLLQALPAEQRDDAVSSLVYEARERLRDPVHGCLGVINDLKKKLADVRAQLACTQAELANISLQHGNLLPLVITGEYHEDWDPINDSASLVESQDMHTNPTVSEDADPMKLWEKFWA